MPSLTRKVHDLFARYYKGRETVLDVAARLICLVYSLAFAALLPQLPGLYGESGILPARSYLAQIADQAGSLKYLVCPTLFWLNASDGALILLTAAGLLLSITGFFRWTASMLWLCFLIYLSLLNIGQDFLSFQWDILLLESGFLAIFVCKGGSRLLSPAIKGLAAVLFGVLIFKLMLLSGLCKLASQDASWSSLEALSYHFLTQPLPTPAAPFLHGLPKEWLKVFCLSTFIIEVFCPFLLLLGRAGKLAAALAFLLLQGAIFLSGNYGFFNILTAVLCLPLIDDRIYMHLLGKPVYERRPAPGAGSEPASPAAGIAALAILLSIAYADCDIFAAGIGSNLPLRLVLFLPRHFYLANSYGLFAVMTTRRVEICIEGSDDGKNYVPYKFYFKPGPPDRPPPIVAPYMPRLDWQMWFEALRADSGEESSQWFGNFMRGLKGNNTSITALLQENPFAGKDPPLYLRARLQQYQFDSPSQILNSGIYWRIKPEAAKANYYNLGP
ncbi:MAG TPA: lipase maturation factor family protein [Candidatus Obscuribacter sp.]|nr:lipase maturation factor family protein [Candidatus Obscuribacter sp.]